MPDRLAETSLVETSPSPPPIVFTGWSAFCEVFARAVDEKFCVKKRRQLPLPKNVRLLTRAGLEPDDLLQNALISVLATARRALDKKGAFVLQNPENRSPEEILACYAGRTFWRRLWKLASAKEQPWLEVDVTEEDWGIDPLTGNDWGTRQSLEGRRSDQPVIASFLPPVGEAKMISVGPNLEKRLGKLESRKDYFQLARDWLKVCQLANFSDSDTYLDCWKVLWLEMDAFWRDYGYPLEDDRGRSFFRRMPLSYRQIFLWDVAGIEVEALAAELKTTPNNIYVRRHRLADWLVKRGALAALQRHLKQLAEI